MFRAIYIFFSEKKKATYSRKAVFSSKAGFSSKVYLTIRFNIKLYKKLERENEILKVWCLPASWYNFLLFVVLLYRG